MTDLTNTVAVLTLFVFFQTIIFMMILLTQKKVDSILSKRIEMLEYRVSGIHRSDEE